ncbi:MAG: restriction endonuclease subunit S [Candidatus Calescibacterium sp.]
MKMKEPKIKFRRETGFKETEIGEIPREWEVKKLGEISEITTGGTPRRNNPLYWNGNINWLKSQEVADNYIYDTEEKITELGRKNSNARKIYSPGTLILALYASPTAGRVAILKTYSTINQALAAIEGENNMFLFFSLIANRERLLLSASGAAQQNLNLKLVKDFEIPYPPLPEQSRIATVLSWFDDLIEIKKRQNEILEKTAMAIFKSWFIDFEPFKDEEFIFNEELGKEIPKGWEVKKIGELAELTNGISYKGDEKYEEPIDDGMIFITLNNILRGGGFKTEYSWIKSERIKEHQTLNEEDLIIANTDMTQEAKVIGSPAIVVFPSDYKGKGVYSHHITKITPKRGELKFFLYSYLKISQNENATFSTGTNVLGLDIDNFKRNKIIILPPSHILQFFHSLVEPLFQKIILNQKQIMTLRKIRDTLLPLLVFGKLRVEEV